MSDHAWTLENLATYLADGLDPAERERFEQHLAACDSCNEAVVDARRLDETLTAIFVPTRPDVGLEDRLVQTLRAGRVGRAVRPATLPLWAKFGLGAAATVLIGVTGAAVSSGLLDHGFSVALQRGSAPPEYEIARLDDFVGQNIQGLDRLPHAPPAQALAVSPDGKQVVDGQSGVTVWREDAPVDLDGLAKQSRASVLRGLGTGPQHGAADHLSATTYSLDGRPHFRESTADDYAQYKAGAADPKTLTDLAAQAGNGRGSGSNGTPAGGGEGPSDGKKHRMIVTNGESLTERGYTNNPTTGTQLWSRFSPPAGVNTNNIGNPYAQSGWSYGVTPGQPQEGQKGKDGNGAVANNYLYFRPGEQLETYKARGFNVQPGPKGAAMGDGSTRSILMVTDGQNAAEANKGDEKPGQKPDDDKSGKATEVRVVQGQDPKPPAEAAAPRRVIIRSGDIEFEIESYDSALATVTKLVTAIKGGFVATANSDKMANGKVRGTVVVRVPPEQLDSFVLDLRRELGKGGELKRQHIGSQDITKQYTDLESRLRAARTMEERLLQIIKTGKGEIKDLLTAEKELGVWRTKIEEIEGELRYYGNLAALSTLTITLAEKELRAAVGVVQTQRVQIGLEAEDVDKTLRAAQAAVADAKGRVTRSELKQLAAGQFNAILHFEVAPEAAGPLQDRFRQLGNVARLESDLLQQNEGGAEKPVDGKVTRKDTQFLVNIYNLANIAPRETVHVNLASPDPEASFKAVLAQVEKAGGRVLSSNLNQQKADQTTASIDFEVKAAEAEAVRLSLKSQGEVMKMQITENADAANVTRSKRGFRLQMVGLGLVAPRETVTLTLATRDVAAAYRALQEAVAKAKGLVHTANLSEQDKQNVTAQVNFDVARADEAAVVNAGRGDGYVYSRSVQRAQDADNVIDSKVRLQVSLIDLTRVPPRETVVLGIEVQDTDHAAEVLTAQAKESQGRIVDARFTRERDGQTTARIVVDVPQSALPGLVEKFRKVGDVRVQQGIKNAQVPDTPQAVARIDVTLSNRPLLPADESVWARVMQGLTWSLRGLLFSLTWLIVGLCFIVPWALVLIGLYRLGAWLVRTPAPATATATATPTAPAQ